jgi:hypothetical protein
MKANKNTTRTIKPSKKATKPKSVTATPANFNSSTEKSGRRQGLLKTVAVRLTNDPSASWSDVGTAFTQALLNKKWEDNLTESEIRGIIGEILDNFSRNNREILSAVIKSPTDVQAALKLSRGTFKRQAKRWNKK